jgi:hypothetical protein
MYYKNVGVVMQLFGFGLDQDGDEAVCRGSVWSGGWLVEADGQGEEGRVEW